MLKAAPMGLDGNSCFLGTMFPGDDGVFSGSPTGRGRGPVRDEVRMPVALRVADMKPGEAAERIRKIRWQMERYSVFPYLRARKA